MTIINRKKCSNVEITWFGKRVQDFVYPVYFSDQLSQGIQNDKKTINAQTKAYIRMIWCVLASRVVMNTNRVIGHDAPE